MDFFAVSARLAGGSRTARLASASVPSQGTMNTASPAPAGQRVAIDSPKIDGAARPAAWAEHVGHDVPASRAARIVSDHSMSRPEGELFQRWTTASVSARSGHRVAAMAADSVLLVAATGSMLRIFPVEPEGAVLAWDLTSKERS
jgi:hypothetical protein